MNDNQAQLNIGDLCIDPLSNTIKKGGNEEKLSPKVMEVCLLLANNVGRVVTREELLNTVWAGRYGGDESLSRAVSELRKALSQVLGADTKFITTVPKRGYRLEKSALEDKTTKATGKTSENAERQTSIVSSHIDAMALNAEPKSSFSKKWLLLAGTLLAVVMAIIAFIHSVKPTAETHSLLIVPFKITDSDNKQEKIISHSLAEMAINSFIQVPQLLVSSRTSSAYFESNDYAIEDVDRLLSVDYLLEGNVRRVGKGYEVIYRLVDVSSGFAVFSRNTSVTHLDMQKVVEEITTNTASHLNLAYKPNEVNTTNKEAFRLFLLATDILNQTYNLESLKQAQEYLLRANALSPHDTLIVEAITSNYLELMNLTEGSEQKEVIAMAKAFLQRSYKLKIDDGTLAFFEGMLMMPLMRDHTSGDIETALAHFAKALQKGERSFNFFFNYIYLLTVDHQYQEALKIANLGITHHPLSYRLYGGLAFVNLLLGDSSTVTVVLAKMREISPNEPVTDWMQALASTLKGEYQETLDWNYQTRNSDELISSLMLDIHVLVAAQRADLLSFVWPLCQSSNQRIAVSNAECFHLSFAEAVYKQDIAKIVTHLREIDVEMLSSQHLGNLVVQSLFLLPKDLFKEFSPFLDELAKQQLAGGAFSNIEAMSLLVRLKNLSSVPASSAFVDISSTMNKIYNQQPESVFLMAEYSAILGDNEDALTLIGQIVSQSRLIPIGRYYAYFESPAFDGLRDSQRFTELEDKYISGVLQNNKSLSWKY